MKSIHNDVVLGSSVAILAALGFWLAMGFSAEARVFPLIVLGPAIPVGLIIAVRGQMRLSRSGENPNFFTSPSRFFLAAAVMVLALIGLDYLGFLTTSAIVIPVMSYMLGFRKPLPVLATTFIFLQSFTSFLFQILSRPLPHEIWTKIGG